MRWSPRSAELLAIAQRAARMKIMVNALGFALAACRGSTEVAEEPGPPPNTPCPPAACLLVTDLESSRTAVIDPATERLLGLTGPQFEHSVYAVPSSDGRRVITGGINADTFAVVGLDVRSGQVQWRVRLDDRETPPGVKLWWPSHIAESPDERSLYVYPVTSGNSLHVARFPKDGGALEAVSQLGTATRIELLRGRGPLPAGTIAIVSRRAPRPAPYGLLLLDPDLSFIDFVELPNTGRLPHTIPAQVGDLDLLISADERSAYVAVAPLLFRVHLASRAIIGQAEIQRGNLAQSPSGDRIYVSDPGSFGIWGSFASGVLSEYTADLGMRRDFDLRPVDSTLPPPRVWHVAVTRDGRRAFLLAGTGMPMQVENEPANVRVLDLTTGQVTNRINLKDYVGRSRLFLFEP